MTNAGSSDLVTQIGQGAPADVLADAGVSLTPVSQENSVTDVLGKVTSGEADAGLVYATDVQRSGGKAEALEIPEAADHATRYPAALTLDAATPDLAQEYLEHLEAEGSQTVLEDAGLGPP